MFPVQTVSYIYVTHWKCISFIYPPHPMCHPHFNPSFSVISSVTMWRWIKHNLATCLWGGGTPLKMIHNALHEGKQCTSLPHIRLGHHNVLDKVNCCAAKHMSPLVSVIKLQSHKRITPLSLSAVCVTSVWGANGAFKSDRPHRSKTCPFSVLLNTDVLCSLSLHLLPLMS